MYAKISHSSFGSVDMLSVSVFTECGKVWLGYAADTKSAEEMVARRFGPIAVY